MRLPPTSEGERTACSRARARSRVHSPRGTALGHAASDRARWPPRAYPPVRSSASHRQQAPCGNQRALQHKATRGYSVTRIPNLGAGLRHSSSLVISICQFELHSVNTTVHVRPCISQFFTHKSVCVRGKSEWTLATSHLINVIARCICRSHVSSRSRCIWLQGRSRRLRRGDLESEKCLSMLVTHCY